MMRKLEGFWLAVLVSLGVLAAATGAVLYLRALAVTKAETNLLNLNRAIAAQTETVLNGAASSLDTIRDRIEGSPGMGAAAIRTLLDRERERTPYFRSLSLFTPEGRMAVSTYDPLPAATVNFSDRLWFKAARDGDSHELVLGLPVESRLDGLWIIPTAIRLDKPDGSLAGLIGGSLDTRFFQELFKAFDLGEGAAITLQMADSAMLTRYPPKPEAYGKTFPGPIFAMLKNQPEGTLTATSIVDERVRIMGGRWVKNRPLYVAISITEEAALTNWRAQALVIAVAALLLIAALVVLGLGHRRLRRHVAARRAAEADLRASLERQQEQSAHLARTNADLEQFAYVASHDLREPLRMISNFLTLAERRLADRLDDQSREFIAYAVDGARRMDALIRDLLDYSRTGRHTDPPGPVDTRMIVERALAHLQVSIGEIGAETAIDGDWPVVTGHADEMTRLFQNLIGNALKFRRPDAVPRIEIGVAKKGNAWEFRIADNGIGIAPEFQDKVFGIFQRLHAHSDYEGTGIGLAVCRKIVERHGGRIWCESEGENQGTVFRFTVPKS